MSELAPKRPINETKDTLLLCLKTFFSTHDEYKWSANAAESKIDISDAFPIDKDNTEQYPLIVLQRFDFGWRSRHLNQTAYNNLQDKHTGLDLLNGSFACLCTSTVGLEAERIAEDVFLFFTRFRSIISSKDLFDIKDLTIGTEQVRKASSDTDIVTVPVRIAVTAEDSWVVQEKGFLFEDLSIRLKTII